MNKFIKNLKTINTVKNIKNIKNIAITNNVKKLQIKQQMIYACDYLNLFSDFREMKYKKQNIDFHQVKHFNKEKDTIEFFEIFFTKYINYVNIDKKSNFIFILKKITNYEPILIKILEKYTDINVRFVVIESKFTNEILDKNKDDLLCQYIFKSLILQNNNCVLISNDRYRDRELYINDNCLGETQNIKVIQRNDKNKNIVIEELELKFEKKIFDSLLNQRYKRNAIPKYNLGKIL